jgi:hypothetical protein
MDFSAQAKLLPSRVCRLQPGEPFKPGTKVFPGDGWEYPSRGHAVQGVSVIMNLFHARETA